MDGIINIYKEKGYTSHDVVAKMRGILRMKKIGHTGTLDPDAEGVLPVCLGKGTRLCDMLADRTKTYRAVLLLGVETDTQDTSGQVLSEHKEEAAALTEDAVTEAVMSFLGLYMQVPPMYSALKVNGKKLYELARAGKEVERQARPVEILDIQVEKISLPRVTMSVTCSKGTYIRTLCYDIGQKLGCGGCMESLLRTRVGQFELKDSLTLSQLEKLRDAGQVEAHVLPVDQVFSALPEIVMKAGDGDKLVHNGNPFGLSPELWACSGLCAGLEQQDSQEGQERWERQSACPAQARVYDSVHQFIGVYAYEEEKKRYKPQKIFLGGS